MAQRDSITDHFYCGSEPSCVLEDEILQQDLCPAGPRPQDSIARNSKLSRVSFLPRQVSTPLVLASSSVSFSQMIAVQSPSINVSRSAEASMQTHHHPSLHAGA